MKFLKWLDSLIPTMHRPYITIESWAARSAELGTPDEIIVAHVMQSFIKNFPDWKLELMRTYGPTQVAEYDSLPTFQPYKNIDTRNMKPNPRYSTTDRVIRYRNPKTKMKVLAWITFHYGYNQNSAFYNSFDVTKLTVNDIEVDPSLGKRVFDGYQSIKEGIEKAEAAAAEAKAAMEANERKWNLVEELQGLMRTEEGALVPKCTPTVTPPSPKETASTSSSTARAKRSKRTARSDALLEPLTT